MTKESGTDAAQEAATAGAPNDPVPLPWGIYAQQVATPEEAKAELARMIDGSTDFCGEMIFIGPVNGEYVAAFIGCTSNSRVRAQKILEALNGGVK